MLRIDSVLAREQISNYHAHKCDEALFMKFLTAIGGIVLLCAGSAFAQGTASPPPGKFSPTAQGPCGDQYEKFCGTVPPGAGRKLICMTQHLPKLTPACRERTQAV